MSEKKWKEVDRSGLMRGAEPMSKEPHKSGKPKSSDPLPSPSTGPGRSVGMPWTETEAEKEKKAISVNAVLRAEYRREQYAKAVRDAASGSKKKRGG